MGVPFHHKHATTNRYDLKLGLIAILAFVIVNVGDVRATDNSANEQYEFHKEYERLQKQLKPHSYSLNEQISNGNQHNRRPPVYQPSFNPIPVNRGDQYGVQQQEQRQEQHHQQRRIKQIETTTYSEWSQNMSYMSSTGYNAMGMTPLFNLTNMIIDLFVDKDEPIPPGNFLLTYSLTSTLFCNRNGHINDDDDMRKMYVN